MERRLAAIMATDVVGYSRLIRADEEGTLAALKALRADLIDPILTEHNGRIVKLMGDGMLAEFASVVDAVRTAVETQVAVAQRNAGLPEDRWIEFRVGVNLGDVVIDGDDIHGDGVNVAARLEGLAKPGGICVSDKVYEEVRDRTDLAFEDLGEQEVKNIDRPVRVFRVLMDGEAGTSLRVPTTKKKSAKTWPAVAAVFLVAAIAGGGAWWWQSQQPDFTPADLARMAFELPEKPSIAILPFDNLSADPEQAYFADGMTDDLITGLSKLSGLFVISRNSTFTYKGKPVKVRQVAEDLGVRYVLEGSVRRAGNQVRINAQLIDALTGFHVWAEIYDRELTDVFELQDDVVGNIVAAMALNLQGQDTLASQETSSTEAYDSFLQGKEQLFVHGPETTANAITFFKKAIELDPGYGRAHAALAAAYWRVFDSSWAEKTGLSTTDVVELAKRHLSKALSNPTPEAYRTSAEMALHNGKHQTALLDIDKAIALDPNDSDSYVVKSYIQVLSGLAEQAEENARLAMRLNPRFSAHYLRQLGRSLYHQDRFEEAAEVFERAAELAPDYDWTYSLLAAVYGQLNRLDEAKAALRRLADQRAESEGGEFTVQGVADWNSFADKTDLIRLQDGLRKAGVPEGAAPEITEADYKSLISMDGSKFVVKGAPTIDLAKAKELQTSGALIIDVRSTGGYQEGHIPGAIGLDLKTQLTKENLAQHAKPDQVLVFYCDGIYCYKSANACAKALTWGYENVLYFAGGMPAWKKAGYAVATE